MARTNKLSAGRERETGGVGLVGQQSYLIDKLQVQWEVVLNS
jgi:hypothetical protein